MSFAFPEAVGGGGVAVFADGDEPLHDVVGELEDCGAIIFWKWLGSDKAGHESLAD